MEINDILARLNKGESAEDIAKDLTNMLNEASKTYEAEQKRIAEEKVKLAAAEKAKKDAAKINDLAVIVDMMNEFLKDYYKVEVKLDAETVLDIIESTMNIGDTMKDFVSHFTIKTPGKPAKTIKTTSKKTADEIFKDLFDIMGW